MAAICKALLTRRLAVRTCVVTTRELGTLLLRGEARGTLLQQAGGRCIGTTAANQRTEEFFKPTDSLSDASGTGEAARTAAGSSDLVAQAASSPAREVVDLSSVGLGGLWPSGLVQTSLEMMYNYIHLPWWGCVAALTVMLRLATLPINVRMQVLSAKLANTNKEAKVYHTRLQECKAAGDTVGASQAGVEIFKMYEREGVNPMMMFPLAIAQAPIFIAMFRGLRGMAMLPVESLKTGGALWFMDLSLPDPYFSLPVLACVSFLVNLQLGGEGGATTDNELSVKVRWFLRIGAVCVLPITIKLPAAVLLYWVTNSFCSMAFILCFKTQAVKNFFGIPAIRKD